MYIHIRLRRVSPATMERATGILQAANSPCTGPARTFNAVQTLKCIFSPFLQHTPKDRKVGGGILPALPFPDAGLFYLFRGCYTYTLIMYIYLYIYMYLCVLWHIIPHKPFRQLLFLSQFEILLRVVASNRRWAAQDRFRSGRARGGQFQRRTRHDQSHLVI